MRRISCCLVAAMMCLAAVPAVAQEDSAEAESPTTEELAAKLVEDPKAIGEMLEGLDEEQTADLVAAAVLAMTEADMADATIRQNLSAMFQIIAEVRGAEFSAAVMTRLRKRVNPRLLPIIRSGIDPPGSTAAIGPGSGGQQGQAQPGPTGTGPLPGLAADDPPRPDLVEQQRAAGVAPPTEHLREQLQDLNEISRRLAPSVPVPAPRAEGAGADR